MVPREILGHSAAALLAVFVLPAGAYGQDREPSLEELETEHLIDQASRAFTSHDLSIEAISADFRYRCLRAIGDTTFCECLVERRPYTLRFDQYIDISSRTRSELKYDTLSGQGKQIVDEVYAVRGDCVDR